MSLLNERVNLANEFESGPGSVCFRANFAYDDAYSHALTLSKTGNFIHPMLTGRKPTHIQFNERKNISQQLGRRGENTRMKSSQSQGYVGLASIKENTVPKLAPSYS